MAYKKLMINGATGESELIDITAEEIKEEPEQEVLASPETLKKLN